MDEDDGETVAFMVRMEAERVLAFWPAQLRAESNPNGFVRRRRRREGLNRNERNWCRRGRADIQRAVWHAEDALDALEAGDSWRALAAGFQMAVHETRGAALWAADEEGNRLRRRGAAVRNEPALSQRWKSVIAAAVEATPEHSAREIVERLRDSGALPSCDENGDFPRGAGDTTLQKLVAKAKRELANR